MNIVCCLLASLAAHFYSGENFRFYTETRIVENMGIPVKREDRVKFFRVDEMPDYAQVANEYSLVYKGSIEIPQSGKYSFKSIGQWKHMPEKPYWHREAQPQRCAIKINGSYRDLTYGEKDIFLPKGKTKLEIFFPSYTWAKERIEWRTPGASNFRPIPNDLLSYDESDLKNTRWQNPCVELKEKPSTNPHILRYYPTIEESGFYVLNIRRIGEFRWGVMNPATLKVYLNGKEVRTYYTTKHPADSFSAQKEVLYLEKGKHEIKLQASGVEKLRYNFSLSQTFKNDLEKLKKIDALAKASRVWMTRLIPGQDDEMAYTLSQSINAESVFKKGEEVKWCFKASTISAKRDFKIKVTRLRDKDTSVVWSDSVSLPKGKKCAEGEIKFPDRFCGAFEYTVYDGNDKKLEGPWEFIIIDTTPDVTPKENASFDPVRDYESIPSGGKKVDEVDFAKEGLNEEHKIRDDGTSKIIKNGKLVYRESGRLMTWGCWHNIDAKDGTDPIPFHGHIKHSDIKGKHKGLTFMNWFGCTFNIKNPGIPHLAVVYMPEDKMRRICVQMVDPVSGYVNGAVYKVYEASKPGLVKMVIPFWPNLSTVDMLTYPTTDGHNSVSTPSAISKIEIYAFPNGFPALREAAAGWNKNRIVSYSGEQGDLGPERAATPNPFNDDWQRPQAFNPGGNGWIHYDYKAYSSSWQRFGEYSRWNGDTELIWPLHSYDMAHVMTERLPWGNSLFLSPDSRGFTNNDRYSRNTFKIILLNCEKYGVGLVGDFQINSNFKNYSGVVADVEKVSKEELKGLFLTDGKQYPAHNFNPAHPIARKFLVGFYSDVARQAAGTKGLKGINLRNLSWSSSISAWFKHWTVGYDEYTTSVFAKECGVEIKGTNNSERYDFLIRNKDLRDKWFKWRVDKTYSLRKEILAGVRKYLPEATLSAHAALVCFEEGNGLDEKLYEKDRDLGFGFKEASSYTYGIEVNTLDPVGLENFDIRPGVKKMTPFEKLKYRSIYPSGICTAGGVSAAPYGTYEWAKALAKEPLDVLTRGGYWCFPPGEESMRRFIQAWRSIPDGEYTRLNEEKTKSVAVWYSDTCAYIVNLKNETTSVKLETSSIVDRVTLERLDQSNLKIPPFGLRVFNLSSKIKDFTVLNEASGNFEKVDSSKEWADKTATKRVIVKMTNPGIKARKRALGIVKGSDIFEFGGEKKTLRVFQNGKELPLQFDPNDEISFLASFKNGESDSLIEFYLDSKKARPQKSAFQYKEIKPNYTNTPCDFIMKTGDFIVGFHMNGIGLLGKDGNAVYRGVQPRGKSGKMYYPILPFSWETKSSELKVVSAGPVRALLEIEANTPKDVETKLHVKGGGNFNAVYLKNGIGKRTYQILAGANDISITDHYSWTKNPGRQMNRFFWYNLSWKGTVSGWDFKVNRPYKNAPYAEYFDPNVGSYNIAVDQQGGGHLQTTGSLMIRFEKPVGTKAGGVDFKMWLRAPDEKSLPMKDWYERVSGLPPTCTILRAETHATNAALKDMRDER